MQNFRCRLCANYLSDNECIAYPEGIPEEILKGENDHTTPLSEQMNNIVFVPIDELNNEKR